MCVCINVKLHVGMVVVGPKYNHRYPILHTHIQILPVHRVLSQLGML